MAVKGLSMIKDENLDFWIKFNYNVLLVGAHGVGKTAIIKSAFERNNLKWLYYSASTMDPWVDLVGVPKEKKNEDGTSYLELVRPKEFQNDEVEALFFDEFNRCLTGNTLIPLADGTEVPISSLEGRSHFYVYSYDLTSRRIRIGRGHSARKTGVQQKIVRTVLDNGESISCTPDHPFLLRSGEYCLACDLKNGDSLMPLYRRKSEEVKVVLVEDAGFDDVYDITVDEYHNFALSSGVIVHNSHKKVRNAVMELIQFKSINGKKFNNLRVVWAAINPDDESYDVEKLDPAQEDRFHIRVDIPYKPHKPYFVDKYGDEIAKAAISWWTELPAEQQKLVSPRRLDYAIDVMSNGGDIRHVLKDSTNVSKLITTLQTGPIADRLKDLRRKGDFEEARVFLSSENNYLACVSHIINNNDNLNFFLPCVSNEKLSVLISQHHNVLKSVMSRLDDFPHFREVVNSILGANQNNQLVRSIKKLAKDSNIEGLDAPGAMTNFGIKPSKPYSSSSGTMSIYPLLLKEISDKLDQNNTSQDKRLAYYELEPIIPSKMPTKVALNTLEVLMRIGASAHENTIIGFKHFMGMVNHCIIQVCENESILDWNVFLKTYSNQTGSLVQFYRSKTKIAERIYAPVPGKVPVWS